MREGGGGGHVAIANASKTSSTIRDVTRGQQGGGGEGPHTEDSLSISSFLGDVQEDLATAVVRTSTETSGVVSGGQGSGLENVGGRGEANLTSNTNTSGNAKRLGVEETG